MTHLTPLYLDQEELLVLLQALAVHVHRPELDEDDVVGSAVPYAAGEASALIWAAPEATPTQRSLATALSEAITHVVPPEPFKTEEATTPLSRIAQKMIEVAETDPNLRAIVMLNNGDEGTVGMGGYPESDDSNAHAMADLLGYVKRVMEANGKRFELRFED